MFMWSSVFRALERFESQDKVVLSVALLRKNRQTGIV